MAAPPHLDHGNRQGEFIGVVVGFTALACAFVMARMYTRAVLVRELGPGEFVISAMAKEAPKTCSRIADRIQMTGQSLPECYA